MLFLTNGKDCLVSAAISPWMTASMAEWIKRPPRERFQLMSEPCHKHNNCSLWATLPDALRFGSALGLVGPAVMILWQDEIANLIGNSSFFSEAWHKTARTDPSLRYARIVLGLQKSRNKMPLCLINSKDQVYNLVGLSMTSLDRKQPGSRSRKLSDDRWLAGSDVNARETSRVLGA